MKRTSKAPEEIQYNVTFLVTVRGDMNTEDLAELAAAVWDQGLASGAPEPRQLLLDSTGFEAERVGPVGPRDFR